MALQRWNVSSTNQITRNATYRGPVGTHLEGCTASADLPTTNFCSEEASIEVCGTQET